MDDSKINAVAPNIIHSAVTSKPLESQLQSNQLGSLKVPAFQYFLFHCAVPPTTATRSYSFWTNGWSDISAVTFNFNSITKNP